MTPPDAQLRRKRIRSASNWSSLLGLLFFLSSLPLLIWVINKEDYLWLLLLIPQVVLGVWFFKLSAAFEALTPPAPRNETEEQSRHA